MAVNLLEEDRLVYHDNTGDAIHIGIDSKDDLWFTETDLSAENGVSVLVSRDAVQTLRDALTCWLETGKLK